MRCIDYVFLFSLKKRIFFLQNVWICCLFQVNLFNSLEQQYCLSKIKIEFFGGQILFLVIFLIKFVFSTLSYRRKFYFSVQRRAIIDYYKYSRNNCQLRIPNPCVVRRLDTYFRIVFNTTFITILVRNDLPVFQLMRHVFPVPSNLSRKERNRQKEDEIRTDCIAARNRFELKRM